MISVTNFSLLGYALFVVCFMTDDVDAIDWAFYHFRPEYKVSARNCTLMYFGLVPQSGIWPQFILMEHL